MNPQELQEVVLRAVSGVDDLRQQVASLVGKDRRADQALTALRSRLGSYLAGFHRDKYKSTDQRLAVRALAEEIRLFDRLGFEIGDSHAAFLLGVGALLEGRNQTALDHFSDFIQQCSAGDPHLGNAHYLSAMICYNRRDYARAMSHFEAAFRLSPESHRDWQCKTYVAELMFFLRKPQQELEPVFREIENGLRTSETAQQAFLQATLYLKWGNSYVEPLVLQPKERNSMANNQVAVGYYKAARKSLPKYPDPDSLLPVVVDYSLAQSLIAAKSVDMQLAQTPSELLADVFRRLRRIVLAKREEIILAQSYFMLGTCAVLSDQVSKDMGEIYLEHARNQTQNVPSDVCFYSCVTKELLSRDEFVGQIDFFARQLEQANERK